MAKLVYCGRTDNDLLCVLESNDWKIVKYEGVDKAFAEAANGSAVIVTADDYPRPSLCITEKMLALIDSKHLRVYCEYPVCLPGYLLGEPCQVESERLVVSSDFFMPDLKPMSILGMHGCWFLPVDAENQFLVMARVAGYRSAVYGLPENTHPILFEMKNHTVLAAVTCLSRFVTGRYAPARDWARVWHGILRWLGADDVTRDLAWKRALETAYSKDEVLRAGVELQTFDKTVRWFREEAIYCIEKKRGVIEGFESVIDHRGRQMRRPWARGDCIGETGMVMAYDWAVNRNPHSRKLACEIIDYVWSAPDFRQADNTSPVYGLNNWFERGPVFYGDDNARVIMATLAASRLLGINRWDEHVLRCMLANLRTTGPLGFRESRFDYPDSFQDGRNWIYYRDHEMVHYSPHFQAYLWATYLWAYALTGHGPFKQKAVTAIRMTMEAYPKWQWTNGFTQELARMILPLAWLVGIDDTAEHREWLKNITDELLNEFQPCGAIREKMGSLEYGKYTAPKSNEEYGTTEASLIQKNGDPACDLLYTANYAFLGLHEAAVMSDDKKLWKVVDKMAEFFCRIQIRSEIHRELDGTWMRGFDYNLWEYWGSSADSSWGAWCVESGWVNSWIASVLAMRHRRETLFDLSLSARLKTIFPNLVKEMSCENIDKSKVSSQASSSLPTVMFVKKGVKVWSLYEN